MKKIKRIEVLMLVITLGFTSSCGDEPLSFEQQLEKDIAIIDEYLAERGINALQHNSGLRFIIHDEGSGRVPDISDEIRVNYEGTLLGDTDVFDGSEDARFPLRNLIQGWQIGLQNMREGDSATLYVPSVLGYGRFGTSGIGPDENLEFNIRLFRVYEF